MKPQRATRGARAAPKAVASRRVVAAGAKTSAVPAVDLHVGRVPGARRAPLASWTPPALATLVTEPPRGDQWIHEIKYDGYRILARLEAGKAQLLSRNGKDWTRQFSRVARALEALPVRSAMLDGEVVVLEPDGTTSFQKVQNAVSHASQQALTYALFDLLYLDGHDLAGVVLDERKKLLARLLEGGGSPVLRYTDHVVGRGRAFLDQVCKHSLEGMVSKRIDSCYRGGRSKDWLKLKCLQGQEFVIGGFTEGSGTRTGFGALLLGAHDEGGLRYVGRVGTGFSEASLRELFLRLSKSESPRMPFADVPAAARRGVHWVKPELVADVAFSGWTGDGQLRHARFRGLREDKAAGEVTLERAEPRAAVEESPGPGPDSAGSPSPRVRGIRIGNASKVLYPDVGVTKLELARYYDMVAPWMLPQVVERPLTLLRCPNGYDAECFFQKNAEGVPEEGIRRIAIPDIKGGAEDSTYVCIEDARGLVTLLQMGVLEIHLWGSHARTLELPDRITFDLDPGPGVSWEAVIDGARLVRSTLEHLGLRSLVMTTGGKGLHVVVPIKPELDWPTVKGFTRSLVHAIVRLEPKRYTGHLAKVRREKMIFIDYLRNGRGSTAVAPYSTRARPGAPVAVPLAWDELSRELEADAFHVRNLHERLKGMKKDPWQQQNLPLQSLARVLASAERARR